MKKDHSNITLSEALAWVEKNCMFSDVRKRLMSRSVAYVLARELLIAGKVIDELNSQLNTYKRADNE
jgi:hypothetical protein